jgi:hypothetical protein
LALRSNSSTESEQSLIPESLRSLTTLLPRTLGGQDFLSPLRRGNAVDEAEDGE